MEIAILVLSLSLIALVISGKPIKIEIKHIHENIVPPAKVIEEKDPDELAKEMKKNALNVMQKFNEEWSGLIDEE